MPINLGNRGIEYSIFRLDMGKRALMNQLNDLWGQEKDSQVQIGQALK